MPIELQPPLPSMDEALHDKAEAYAASISDGVQSETYTEGDIHSLVFNSYGKGWKDALATTAQQAQAVQPAGWRPIETAPKDGSLFLCWVQAERGTAADGESSSYAHDVSQIDFCNWRTQADIPDCGWFEPCCGQIGDRQDVTHWMPLLDAPGATTPPQSVQPPALSREKLVDIIREATSYGVYHCTRVWEAWNVGTMSEEDFEPYAESDSPEELADLILAALAATPTQATQPARRLPMTPFIPKDQATATTSGNLYAFVDAPLETGEADAKPYPGPVQMIEPDEAGQASDAPPLMQDEGEGRGLSRWLSSQPDAALRVREAERHNVQGAAQTAREAKE